MTIALAAAIGVLLGWFGRPLWLRLVDRIWMWRMQRRDRRSPSPASTLASVAEVYKRLYAPDVVGASRPAPMLRVIRKAEPAEVVEEWHIPKSKQTEDKP